MKNEYDYDNDNLIANVNFNLSQQNIRDAGSAKIKIRALLEVNRTLVDVVCVRMHANLYIYICRRNKDYLLLQCSVMMMMMDA